MKRYPITYLCSPVEQWTGITPQAAADFQKEAKWNLCPDCQAIVDQGAEAKRHKIQTEE